MNMVFSLIIIASVIAILLILTIGPIILDGYVFSVLWGWFIVPIFQLPELTLAVAVGIMMMIKCFTYQYHTDCYINKNLKNFCLWWENRNYPENKNCFKVSLAMKTNLTSLYILFAGWIIHLFM
jgi:hypothetical protein